MPTMFMIDLTNNKYYCDHFTTLIHKLLGIITIFIIFFIKYNRNSYNFKLDTESPVK